MTPDIPLKIINGLHRNFSERGLQESPEGFLQRIPGENAQKFPWRNRNVPRDSFWYSSTDYCKDFSRNSFGDSSKNGISSENLQ